MGVVLDLTLNFVCFRFVKNTAANLMEKVGWALPKGSQGLRKLKKMSFPYNPQNDLGKKCSP